MLFPVLVRWHLYIESGHNVPLHGRHNQCPFQCKCVVLPILELPMWIYDDFHKDISYISNIAWLYWRVPRMHVIWQQITWPWWHTFCFLYWFFKWWTNTGTIFWMLPATERRCYSVVSSLIGCVHSQNDSCQYDLDMALHVYVLV